MDIHLALSSLITLTFFLTLLPPSHCTDYERFVECSRPFECGRIMNVSYPFWGGERPEYCGRQGFELKCRYNEFPIIKFEEVEFLVLNISQSQNNMTIARWDLLGGYCPQNYHDTVLNYSFFDYTSAVINITLFYDCPSDEANKQDIPVQHRFKCSRFEGSDENFNYYFVTEKLANGQYQVPKICQGRIRVPILRNAIINESAGVVHELREALNRGFEVDYINALNVNCSGCEHSGGYCGSNAMHQFVCFCLDGERSYNCPAGNNMYSLFSSHFPGLG